jgi:TPR repeat protein
MYERGLGVKKDVEEAKKYYKLSAKEQNGDAQVHLGILYEKGNFSFCFFYLLK